MFPELLLPRSRQSRPKGRIRAAESSCTLQDASRAAAPGTRAALYLPTGRLLHACVPLLLSSIRHTDNHSERESEGVGETGNGIIIDDGVGEQRVWWLNNKCGILGFV